VLASKRSPWNRAAALLLALAAASLAHADYKRDYAQGVDAAKAGNWSEVETFMNSALKESSEPQAKVKVYGMRFEPYVPQYYLGLAAYKRGDCATAMKAWADGPTKAIVDGNPTLSGPFGEGTRDCAGKAGPSTTVVASNNPPTNPTTPPPVKPNTPTNPANPPTNPANPPTNPANPPTNPANPPTNPSTNPSTTVVATNNPPVNPVTPPTPTPKPTPPANDEPPADLVTALDNYLNGKYAQAAQVNPGQLGDAKAKYQAFLVRAAARYTQSQVLADGAALLAQAEADVRAAKALSPAGNPDPSIFSPRFKAFYAQTK
jgi:hypothetical protein